MQRFLRFIVAAMVLAVTGGQSVPAINLPWRDARPAIDPRDAAFAAPLVVPSAKGIPWGIPLKGGAIRALIIAPRFSLRDAAELAGRLELEITAVPLWDAAHLGRPDDFGRDIPGASADDVLKNLREQLDKKLDVIIAANFDFAVLPPEALQMLAEKVKGGAGLVLAHHRHTLPDALKALLDEVVPAASPAPVTQGIGERGTGEWASGLGFVQIGTLGTGRVVELDIQGERPLTHCLVPAITNPVLSDDEQFDTYLSLAARAVRWAAGRDAAVTIDRVESAAAAKPETEQIPPGLEEMVESATPTGGSLFHPYVLHLSAPSDRTYTVRTEVRQNGRGLTPVTNTWKNAPLQKGAQTYEFYVIAGAGEYWLDIWLLDNDQVVQWYTDVVKIEGWPSISDLIVAKTSVQPQDSVGISFTLPSRSRPCIVLARATDTFGRVVAETHQQVAPQTTYVQTGLKFSDLLGDVLKVELFASDRNTATMPEWDTRFCAYASKYITVRNLFPADRFAVGVSVDGKIEFNARTSYRGLKQAGFSVAAVPALEESARTLSVLGLHVLPQVASYVPERVEAGARVPCLSDPAFTTQDRDRVKTVAMAVRDYPVPAFSLGARNALAPGSQDVCRAPATLAGFAEYARKVHGDLDAANKAWGTSYADWGAIIPPDEAQAREAKQYAQWIDFRCYMDSVFVGTHLADRAVVRSVDSRARAGFGATAENELFAGYDWNQLASGLDFLIVPADRVTMERVQNVRGPTALTGIALPGTALTPDQLRWLPWFTVLHGAQSVWWPEVEGSTAAVPGGVTVDAFGNPVAYAPEFFSEARSLQTGLDRLLLRAGRANSGIALYASRPSEWLNQIDAQFQCSSLDAMRAYADALDRLGYEFDFVTPEQAVKGKLAGYRMLILPLARAMSDEEVKAVRAFSAAGGSVLADVAPAAFDAHGVRRAASPLADLFGVRYAKPSAAGAAANALVEIEAGGKKASGEFTGTIADIAVEPQTASVGGIAGAAPLWLMHREKALAVLTNHAIAGEALRHAEGLLDAVLRDAGAQPVLEIETKRDRPFEGDRFAFTYGSATVYALLANPNAREETQKLTLHFDRSAHVYDVRLGKAAMRPGKVDVELGRGATAVYAVLPYEPVRCALTVPPSSKAGARLPIHAAIEVKKGKAGEHLLSVEVISLQAQGVIPIPHYATTMACKDGEGDGFIPFAMNDRPGVYKIVVRDLLSGLFAESIVNLTAEKQG